MISYKSLIDSKPLRIRLDEIDEFIRIYDETKNLFLFGNEKYDSIYHRIKYHWHYIITISHNYATVNGDSYDSLNSEKNNEFCNVMVLIKSVWNKDKNSYYNNIFLEKVLFEFPKKNLCIRYKCYIMMQLTSLEELILKKQVHKKECDICHD